MRSKRMWLNAALVFVMIAVMLMIRYKSVIYTNVHPAFQTLESQRISRGIAGYETLEEDEFYIRYKAGDTAAAEMLQDIAASWGARVLDFFAYEREKPVGIILFAHEEELKGMLRIPQGQSAMGAYAGGRINLLSPNRFGSMNQRVEALLNVFVHELAHLVVDDIAKGNYPLWFTEGSALYLEYELLDYEWGSELSDAIVYSVEDLTYRFASLDEYLAYRQSFLLVRGLIEEHGRDQYIELLYSLGNGREFNAALRSIYGFESRDMQKYLGPANQ